MVKRASFSRSRSFYLLNQRRRHFLGSPWAGGSVLVIFALIALILSNTEATKEAYHHILTTELGISFGDLSLKFPVEMWINDGLMVIFFFVVGLEIKRELIAGELSSIKHASLPIAAAIGGMVVPALIYHIFNAGTPYEAGWGVPMATDIAFAIGILSLLGKRVPISLKIFLTALAIVDDLGAILVIAIFYTEQINFIMLGASGIVLAFMFLLNRQKVYKLRYYVIPAILLWILFLNSGIHATIAGVLIAMLLPSTPRFSKKYFSYKVNYFLESFKFHDISGTEVLSNDKQFNDLHQVESIATNTISLSQRLEHSLNPFVTFFIMPIFALANAGVEIGSLSDLRILTTTQGMGIYFGLVCGKPLGIVLFSWITIKTKLAVMPMAANWKMIFGVACLGGIGFTMSIFINNLAFIDQASQFIDSGKIAILIASLSAGIVGALVINILGKIGK